MVDKVTSIDRDTLLGEFCDARNFARIPEELLFAVGVLSTVGLPQLILSVYGGLVPTFALAGATLAGSVAGLLMYRRQPARMPRCIDAQPEIQFPLRKDNTWKKAA